MNIIKDKVKDPFFYIFSDDIEYAKKNIQASNILFISHNFGTDSWQDMYLMSQCKHNIIANSTFSWWSAYLNAYTDKIVIAPEIWWYGSDTKDVIPENWIKI